MNAAWMILGCYCASQTVVVLLLKLAALRPASFWWHFGGERADGGRDLERPLSMEMENETAETLDKPVVFEGLFGNAVVDADEMLRRPRRAIWTRISPMRQG
jgi:hypothetical protein